MYIDFHTHKQKHPDNSEVIEVVSVHPGQNNTKGLFTIGYHPWWIQSVLSSESLNILYNNLDKNESCIGLGECGLDTLKGIDIEIQESAFVQQIELANSIGAPLIIHCVRSFDRLLRLRKKLGKTVWVVHGFVRNVTLAKQLLDYGCFLSMAPNIGMKTTFRDTVKYCPSDRLFLETDSNPSVDIKSIYNITASLRNISIIELQKILFENFKYFYRWKQSSLPGWSELSC